MSNGRERNKLLPRAISPTRTLLAVALLILLLPHAASAASNPFKTIERKYHIRVLWDKLPFPIRRGDAVITGVEASKAQVKAAADLLGRELSYYSRDIIQRIRLRKVVVAQHLGVNDRKIGGWADTHKGTFYLNASRILADEDRIRRVFHHELFHMIDFQDDGRMKRDWTWEKLNPASFRYGTGGYDMLNDPRAGLLTDKYPGFINRYSTSSVAEDKAEIYSHMVTYHALMREIAKKDPIVRAKMKAMRQLLERFHPLMNARFWRQFEKGAPLPAPAALKAVLKLIRDCEAALKRGRLFEAYLCSMRAAHLARQKLSGEQQAACMPQITNRLVEIYTVVAKPLDTAEKSLQEKDPGAALDALYYFEKHFKRFTVILEFGNKYEQLSRTEAIRLEKRERLIRKKIAAGDAALKRRDYRSAEKWYSSAARLYKDTEAAKVAQAKLDALLADPDIVKTIKEQTAELECTALLARAQMLINHGEPTQAAAVYDGIMAKYPDTEWAEKARKAKAKIPAP